MTIGRWMIAVAICGVCLALTRAPEGALVWGSVFLVFCGPAAVGIVLERARGGLGIKGAAVASSCAFGLGSITLFDYARLLGGAPDLANVAFAVGVPAFLGAIWGAFVGFVAAFLIRPTDAGIARGESRDHVINREGSCRSARNLTISTRRLMQIVGIVAVGLWVGIAWFRTLPAKPHLLPSKGLPGVYDYTQCPSRPYWPKFWARLLGQPWPGRYTCPRHPGSGYIEDPRWDG
jgi:hypothetical protein